MLLIERFRDFNQTSKARISVSVKDSKSSPDSAKNSENLSKSLLYALSEFFESPRSIVK